MSKPHQSKPEAPLKTSRLVLLHQRIYMLAELAYKKTVQALDDIYTLLFQAVASLMGAVGVTLSEVLGRTIERKPFSASGVLKAVIALPIVLVVSAVLGAVLLVFGSLASIFGLRNVGEYKWTEQLLAWALILVLIIVAPLVFSEFALFKITIIATFAMGVIGMEFLNGQCGMISLGHSGFLFVSGFFTAWLTNGLFGFQSPILLSVFLAALVSAFFGLLLGLPSLRVKDHYLVIVTLTFTIATPKVLKSKYLSTYSGLQEGGLFLPDATVPQIFAKMPPYIWKYFLVMVPAGVLFFAAYNLVHYSQVGRALRTIRCDTEVTTIMGIPVVRYKLLAFVLSAFYAGIAGGFLVMINRYISPDSYGMHDSVEFLVGNIVGGPGGLLGSVFGGAFLTFEQEITRFLSELIPAGKDWARAFFGGSMILVILFMPLGIAGQISVWLKSMFMPPVRRGSFQMSPPPDYDFLNEKRETFRRENTNV